MDPSRHAWFDAAIPTLTVFLHEDTLARMLAFELDLAKLRLDSMAAGFGDPGRPSYERVFEVSCLLASFSPGTCSICSRPSMMQRTPALSAVTEYILFETSCVGRTNPTTPRKFIIPRNVPGSPLRTHSQSSIPYFLFHFLSSTLCLAWPPCSPRPTTKTVSLEWV